MQRREVLVGLAGFVGTTGCLTTSTGSEDRVLEVDATALLLTLDQLPTGWTRSSESPGSSSAQRVFRRNDGTSLRSFAQVEDTIGDAEEAFQAELDEVAEQRSTDDVDLGDAAFIYQDDGVVVAFREQNAIGEVYQHANVVAEQETLDFAELMYENYTA